MNNILLFQRITIINDPCLKLASKNCISRKQNLLFSIKLIIIILVIEMGACISVQEKSTSPERTAPKHRMISRASMEQLQVKSFQVLQQVLVEVGNKLNLASTPTADRIFKASDHKYSAAAFHKHCNNRTNTIVLACSDQKRIFGGFASCAWKQDEYLNYEEDPSCNSFLFTAEGLQLRVLPLKADKSTRAIMNDQQCGPVFGEGYDLYIRDQCHKVQNWNNVGKSYQSKHIFGSTKANQELTGSEKSFIKDYQVWVVKV